MFKVPPSFRDDVYAIFCARCLEYDYRSCTCYLQYERKYWNNLFFTGTRNNYFAIIFGMIADRFFASQKVISNFTHLKWLGYVATTYIYFRR